MVEHTTRHVYFIGDDANYRENPIKIGTAKDIEKRLQTLQIGSPNKLRILGFIPFGDMFVERQLHYRCQAFHIRGEWFAPNYKLLSFIRHRANPRTLYCMECRSQFFDWFNMYYKYHNHPESWLQVPKRTVVELERLTNIHQPHKDGCSFGPHYISTNGYKNVRFLAWGWLGR